VAQRTGGSYGVDCALGTLGCFFALPLYGVCYGMTRHRLRQQQHIAGSAVADCCLATLLPPCVLAQELNHLDLASSQAALALRSSPAQRAAAAAEIPTEVVSFSGRGRRLSDVAPPPAEAAAAAAATAAAAAAAAPSASSSGAAK
jgi:hypothetical protein